MKKNKIYQILLLIIGGLNSLIGLLLIIFLVFRIDDDLIIFGDERIMDNSIILYLVRFGLLITFVGLVPFGLYLTNYTWRQKDLSRLALTIFNANASWLAIMSSGTIILFLDIIPIVFPFFVLKIILILTLLSYFLIVFLAQKRRKLEKTPRFLKNKILVEKMKK